MVSVPKTTPEGYHILIYRLSDTDPAKMNFSDAIRSFCMFNDMRISEDGLTEGYIVVFDMKGLKLGHLAKIHLGSLRAFMTYIQVEYNADLTLRHVVVISHFAGSSSGSFKESFSHTCSFIHKPNYDDCATIDQIGSTVVVTIYHTGTIGRVYQ